MSNISNALCEEGKGRKMADKKLVEAITAMEDDFAQWYTDVVKKAELWITRASRGAWCLSRRAMQSGS